MTKEEIKNYVIEHKECCKKLAEEYRQRYNEDNTNKLALNMFYHNVISYNDFETILATIEDRNSMIMCFSKPPVLTEETVEINLKRIEYLEKENAELRKIAEFQQSSNMNTHLENKKLKEGLAIGSTFNKANEWHYVKDGDLPNDTTSLYLVRVYSWDFGLSHLYKKYGMYIPIVCEWKGEYFSALDEMAYSNARNIKNCIAWKEIVLPKEIK